MQCFTISICETVPQFNNLITIFNEQKGYKGCLKIQEATSKSVALKLLRKKKNNMSGQIIYIIYTPTRDIYLQKLPMLLTLQMKSNSVWCSSCKKYFYRWWKRMIKMINNRYKVLQINFDISTSIRYLGPNFVHSFRFLEKLNHIILLSSFYLFQNGLTDLLNLNSSHVISKYILLCI